MVEAKTFRQDLYFRLNVLPISLPPLRNRSDDIPLLISHFLQGTTYRISSEAMALLKSYPWPGNIRELQNLSERIKVLGENSLINSEWVKQQLAHQTPVVSETSALLDDEILALFREFEFRNDANTKIAKRLGDLHRSTITEYLKGLTFRFFSENTYQLDKAVRCFNAHPNATHDARIRNRMIKYLRNLLAELEPKRPIDENLESLRQRIRKLPQRYHKAAIDIARAYLQGQWKI